MRVNYTIYRSARSVRTGSGRDFISGEKKNRLNDPGNCAWVRFFFFEADLGSSILFCWMDEDGFAFFRFVRDGSRVLGPYSYM